MGFPKQEQWIHKHHDKLLQTVMMGVGGSFEVLSGAKKRAPKIFQKLNIEWVFRLLIDWKRIGRMVSIPKFMLKSSKTKKKNEIEIIKNRERWFRRPPLSFYLKRDNIILRF